MPQLQLPIFHEGTHLITPNIGYQRENGQITYLNGMMPVFTHEVDDTASFQMIVSQFYVNGIAKQIGDIVVQLDYAKHWKRQFESVEMSVRENDLSILGQSGMRKFKLMQSFSANVADILEFLSDVLIQGDINEMLCDDFSEVLKLLPAPHP